VRFLGKAVLCTAVAIGAAVPVVAKAEGHQVAVVDVAYIFKNHAAIKAQVAEVEAELKAFDQELTGKREELKNAAAELKTFKVGSPEYAQAEERVAGMESRLRLDMARKRKEISDAEAKIYFDNYQRIAAGVKYLANHYKINLVLRYNSEEMDLEQGESVIRGVMKSIVYHDESLDMTKGVMQYLDQTMKTAVATGQRPATAAAPTANR
jgi:Skp family chaperone for outer membrane proteins